MLTKKQVKELRELRDNLNDRECRDDSNSGILSYITSLVYILLREERK